MEEDKIRFGSYEFKIQADETIPENELHLMNENKETVGKIVNIES